MPDPKARVEALREKLEAGERGGDEPELLLEFSDRLKLLRETYGWYRHVKLLRHCARIAEQSPADLGDSLEDRDAAEEIVTWIHDTYDLEESPETNQNYRVALRVFGRRVTDEGVGGDPENPPPSIDWINSTLPSDYDPSPDPNDMLEWDAEITPMIDAAQNPRDKAAIALGMDAGFRGGELYELDVGDVQDGKHGLSVSVDGKTGERHVSVVPAVPYLNRWLDQHPTRDDGDPLWCSLHHRGEGDVERLSYQAFLNMFKRPAKRAGVDKPVTPTALRKSNLRWLVRQGVDSRIIEQRQGRKPGSDAVARYVGLFEEDSRDAYAEAMGLEVDDADQGPEDLAPIPCPRCGVSNSRANDFCEDCDFALDPEARAAVDSVLEALDEFLVGADSADVRQRAVRARNRVEEDLNEVGTGGLHDLVASLDSD